MIDKLLLVLPLSEQSDCCPIYFVSGPQIGTEFLCLLKVHCIIIKFSLWLLCSKSYKIHTKNGVKTLLSGAHEST